MLNKKQLTDHRNMFYGASPLIFERAKALRKNLTFSERKLWQELRSNKILGLRFKSQHPIGEFIADFYCHKLKLVIEVDGAIHLSKDQGEYDQGRTYELNQLGIKILRIKNEEIEKDLSQVVNRIKTECDQLMSPLQGGWG
ncbi:endonuclease domain-containing protein [Marinoscillum sp.]|uniref:endonuclease domain-containing protein n=1 Tax=Marinoscillum sp. TaxID=2024838 RepID=UPI003BACD260